MPPIVELLEERALLAPVLANGSTLDYTENQSATPINSVITVTFAGPTTKLVGGSVTFAASTYDDGEDVLGFVNDDSTMGNIVGSFNAGTGVISLSSENDTATREEWEQALRAVTYVNLSDAPSTVARTVSYVVSDGSVDSNIIDSTINVAAANDAPVLDDSRSPRLSATRKNAPAPTGLTGAGTPITSLVDFAVPAGQVDNVTDPDPGGLLGIVVTGADTTNGTWFYTTNSNNGNAWTALGSVAGGNALRLFAEATTRLYFQPNPGFSGTIDDAITFHAWDRSGGGGNGSRANPGAGGGTSPYSSQTDTASITVVGITVTPTSLETTEAAGADHDATFTVVLDTQPAANVTITLSLPSGAEGTLDRSLLTFTNANWNAPQTVTVTATDDDEDDGNVTYTILTNAATSTDPDYSGLNANDVSVTNLDDDLAEITVTPTALTTTEATGSSHTASFTVVLGSAPTANVTIALSSNDTSEGTIAPTSITFTPANWNSPQTVTVTGVDDGFVDGDQTYSIVTAPAVSQDPSYSGRNAPDISVTNRDNAADFRVEISANPSSVTIGEKLTYTITVTNLGPSPDSRTLEVRFRDLDLDGADADLQILTPGVDRDGNVITYTTGVLSKDETFVRTLEVKPLSGAAGLSELTTEAVLQADPTSDPNPANDSDEVSIALTSSLEVRVNSDTANGAPDTDIPFSLRWAINLANALPNAAGQPDVIVIKQHLAEDTISLLRLLPHIEEPVILRFESGAGRVTIDAGMSPSICDDNLEVALQIDASGAGSVIQDLAIINYKRAGIVLSGGDVGSVILDTFVGFDAAGNPSSTGCRGQVGISIEGSSNNTVGGSDSGNLIGNHTVAGIQINGGASNRVIGNHVGAKPDGTAADNLTGILVTAGTDTTIGAPTATAGTGAGNVIAGNVGDAANPGAGIRIEADAGATTRILGNLIGATIQDGSAVALGNRVGVSIEGLMAVAVGGTGSGDGNRITGNAFVGVHITAGPRNVAIAGNVIGRDDASDATGFANARGVLVEGTADTSDVRVGDTAAGARNIISGNVGAGIEVRAGAHGVRIQGNWIGLDSSGAGSVGNGAVGGDPGILLGSSESGVDGTSTNVHVGGTVAAARNVISGNAGPGIEVTSEALGSLIQGNWIGLDAFGGSAQSNGVAGVLIAGATNATVGGDATGAGNVISGNTLGAGVKVTGGNMSGVRIQANLIGTDSLGFGTIGNQLGVFVEGAAGLTIGGPGAGNTVSGNTAGGVRLVRAANTFVIGNVISGNGGDGVALLRALTTVIAGNRIGTRPDGLSAFPNAGAGVLIDIASAVTVGGTTAQARNLISGNSGPGVEVSGGDAEGVRILNNYIGTNLDGSSGLGNGSGVFIDGESGVHVGGPNPGEGNVISGNAGSGVWISGPGASGNLIRGNFIGTNPAGIEDVGNAEDGVLIELGASSNQVGGMAATPGQGPGNLISGNNGAGVRVRGASTSSNLIRGNLIGTRLGGNAGLGNSNGGVVIEDHAASNSVGGIAANARNVISANNVAGVSLGAGATHNLVAANLIGIGAGGSTRLGNVGPGVNIDGGTDNTVGGVVAAARNIIGGNEGDGVRLHGDATRRNTILGNFVGTNEAGSVGRGNSGNGISIDAALNNTVGGATGDPGKGAGNLVSANGGDGVQLSQGATGNLVGGNLIGSDLAGTSELGNTNSGVSLNNAIANTIGTSAGSSPNRIAFNSIGVRFNGGSGNTVSGNTIDHNDSDGVQLTGGAKDQRFASNTVRDNVGNGFSILGAQESPSPNNSPSNNWIGQGNVIRNNSLHGVQLSGPESKGNRVLGSTIVENRLYGVFISNAKQNFIGPETVPADRNVIAGNQSHGVVIQGLDATGNWVGNNLVGTESGPGNQGDGVVILDGGNNTVQHNKIAMNLGSGVVITNTNPGASTSPEPNFIQDNEIGLFGIGGNVLHGLSILNSGNNRILRNTIAHSGLHGVSLFGSGAHSNILEGNRITANKLDGLNLVDAPNNRIQGHNEIWSNHNEGIEISGQGSTGNTVERNSIISNALVGVRVVSAAFNIIGVGNVISGNGGAGVEITGASGGTVVRGNMIGVAADGMRELGNAIGVLLNETGNVTVGGATDGSANIISGNKRTGVQIAGTGSKDNFILNNLIGLAPDGTTFLGNGRTNVEAVSGDGVGVWVVEASRNTIRGNLISGNDFAGVHIQGRNATNNLVWENRIGVDANDQTPYQRAFPGVAPADRIVQDFKLLQEHEDSYRAQGILPQTHGVLINATIRNLVKSNLIAGNDIGVRAIGDTSTTDDANPRGNRNHNNRIQGNSIRDNEFGILIDGAPDITVGHEATRKVDWKAAVNEYANTIHHNLSIGVTIRGGLAVRNLVKGNIIIANQGQTWLPLERPDDPQRSKAHIGTGIYVERANTNKIEQNKLMGNKLAGVYFFDNSWNNKVRRNRITPSDGVRADYGVLLFNSARNVFDVVRKGRGRNIIKSSFIANFREFTGPRTNTLVELPDLPFELETAQASTPAGPVALLKRGGGRNRRG